MRKQLKTNVEIGDANYVKPGEFFMTLSNDGKTPTSIQRRKDNLDMEVILGKGSDSGDGGKAFRLNLTAEQLESFINGNDTVAPQITPEIFAALRGGEYDSIILNMALEGFDEESGNPIIDYNDTSTLPILSEKTRKNLEMPTYFDDWVIAGDSYEFTSEIAASGLGIWKDENDDVYYIGMGSGRFVIACIPAPYINTATGTASGNKLLLDIPPTWLYWVSQYRNSGKGIIIDSDFYPFYTNQQAKAFLNTTHYEGGFNLILVGNWSGDKTTGNQYVITLSPTDKKVVLDDVTNWDGSTGPIA